MSKTINFELVSPERKLMSEAVHMAILPGDEGMFGVLAGHASLVSSLKFGVLKIHRAENDNPVKYFIAGGFADVTAEQCTVLAEEAVLVSDLDAAGLESSLKDLNEDYDIATDAIDRRHVKEKIALVNAKIYAATHSK